MTNTRKPLDDLPATADLLGIEHYMTGLTTFLEECSTPMTVAVQGDWGTGKTTVMNIVADHLRASSKPPQIIHFNTWQYSQLGGGGSQTAASLLWEVSQAIATCNTHAAGPDHQKSKRLLMQAGQFLMSPRFLKAATITAAEGVGRMAGLGILVDAIEKGVDTWDAASNVDAATAAENPFREVALLTELRRTFAEAITETGARFVIFVDDLDRLQPVNAVEVMEAIKVLLDVENCIFVLAIDFEVVKLGVQQKYGADIGAERAQSFFDKIIQVPFNLPTSSYNTERYLAELMQSPDTSQGGIRSQLARASVGTNPRSIKRIFNTLQLLRIIAEKQAGGASPDERHETHLFAMLCLQTRYPSVYAMFCEKAAALAEGEEGDLEELFASSTVDGTTETDGTTPDGEPFALYPDVLGDDIPRLTEFLDVLRLAFTEGGTVDYAALKSAVTSSAVTARDGHRTPDQAGRTTLDAKVRFDALRKAGAAAPLIELLQKLDERARDLGVYFGMQKNTKCWTGYIEGTRRGNGATDTRFYLVSVLGKHFHLQFEKVSMLPAPDEFRSALKSAAEECGLRVNVKNEDYSELQGIENEQQLAAAFELLRHHADGIERRDGRLLAATPRSHG